MAFTPTPILQIDEVCIHTNAVWTSNFTPPASPCVPDAPPPPPPPPCTPLQAPPPDHGGMAIDRSIDVAQALVNNPTRNPAVAESNIQLLNMLQVEAVDHYMVTGWCSAVRILQKFQPPIWDKVGQALVARVAFLQNLVDHPQVMPPGNADGFGAGGIVTILQNSQVALYAAQIAVVERIMDVPGGTSAATILCEMTGFQSFPFEYVFTSIGLTDEWTDN